MLLRILLFFLLPGLSWSHFQVLKPNLDIVSSSKDKNIILDIVFTHPMELGPVMEMGQPKVFGVLYKGKKIDLQKQLKVKKINGKSAYRSKYILTGPGDHIFYIEPAPYWEPDEGKMIIHYTKVVVNAFSEESGWNDLVGFPVEIEPLVRPYGLWTGNAFRGIVKKNKKPVPFAEIEVEFWNEKNKIKAPSSPFVTQVIKADQNGVFSYTMPKSGWWGFAALVDGDNKIKNPTGKMVDVELGALLWVKTINMR